jgi:hypothetical protein
LTTKRPETLNRAALMYRARLLPDPRDHTRGNAAPLWRLASDVLREAKHKITNQEFDCIGTPLNKLPRKEVHDFLTHYSAALRLARQAACREHCDSLIGLAHKHCRTVSCPLAF